MTRRFILAALAAAVADPERLIWEPGRKLISIPKARILAPGYFSVEVVPHGNRFHISASWDPDPAPGAWHELAVQFYSGPDCEIALGPMISLGALRADYGNSLEKGPWPLPEKSEWVRGFLNTAPNGNNGGTWKPCDQLAKLPGRR